MTIDVRYKDRMLLPLPMFHVAALTTVIFCAARGITLVSMPQLRPDEGVVADRRGARHGWLAVSRPSSISCARCRSLPNFEAPHFRYFITGGAPMPKALIEIYAAKNMQVVQGYALTESCGGGTLLLNEDALRKIGSAGRAAMFTDIRVRDADGRMHDQGSGEVVMKSDFLLKEYWNRPDATARCLRQWLVPHRRYRRDRRRGLHFHQGPHQGHDHLRRRKHLPGRNRERDHRSCVGQAKWP